MPRLKKLKQHWKDVLIEKPNPGWYPLFDDFKEHVHSDSDSGKLTLVANGRFRDFSRMEMMGAIAPSELEVGYNKLRRDLISIIDNIKEEDLKINAGPETENTLNELLKELNISRPLTPFRLVNCDRRTNVRKFRKARRTWNKEQKTYQFYFILGCHTQKPDGFAERMVYEIIRSIEDQNFNADFPRYVLHDRMKIDAMPIGTDIEYCIREFKKYFSKRFQLAQIPFEEYLANQFRNKPDGLIVFPFYVSANDWEGDLMEDYLDWIYEHFANEDSKGPTCVFIFVIRLKNAHNLEKLKYHKDVFDEVKDYAVENEERLCFLYPFNEVPRYFLDVWLSEVDEQITQINKNQIIDTFLQQTFKELPNNYQDDDFLIDMEEIQRLQNRIWEIHH